jgi:hypothetical protein
MAMATSEDNLRLYLAGLDPQLQPVCALKQEEKSIDAPYSEKISTPYLKIMRNTMADINRQGNARHGLTAVPQISLLNEDFDRSRLWNG